MSLQKKMMMCGAVCCVVLSAGVAYPMHKFPGVKIALDQFKKTLNPKDPFNKSIDRFVKECELLCRVPNAKKVSRKLKTVVGKQNTQQNKKTMKTSFQAQRKRNRGGKKRKPSFDKRGFTGNYFSKGGGKR